MERGDLLYFWAEEQDLMVVMADENGARVYDIGNPEFTDEGFVKTKYFSYAELNEMCSYLGNATTLV